MRLQYFTDLNLMVTDLVPLAKQKRITKNDINLKTSQCVLHCLLSLIIDTVRETQRKFHIQFHISKFYVTSEIYLCTILLLFVDLQS